MESPMNLEQKIPPVIVTTVFALLMLLSSIVVTSLNIELMYSFTLSVVSLIVGIVFIISGIVSFRIHRTTVNPVKTDNVSTLVKSGIYQYTRNPMYVGMLLMLCSYCFYLSNILNLIFIALFVTYMNKFQIKPEEVFLNNLFGHEYLAYKRNVRRWL
jgi:protein-S-isoprenylcysteine O-methyltransferase Ste14